MKYLALVAAVCLLMVPSVALAQQISPNPNPSGNTITVDTKDGRSRGDFDNYGTIDIKGNINRFISSVLSSLLRTSPRVKTVYPHSALSYVGNAAAHFS